jgi:hypothetical protein
MAQRMHEARRMTRDVALGPARVNDTFFKTSNGNRIRERQLRTNVNRHCEQQCGDDEKNFFGKERKRGMPKDESPVNCQVSSKMVQ